MTLKFKAYYRNSAVWIDTGFLKPIMQKRTFLSVVTAAAALSVVPAWANQHPKRTLIVGMDATYPPFGSQDSETRQYVGYDVDIIRAIGKAEGFDVEVRNLAFDGLIPALKTGNIDIAINDITISPERAKSVDFSNRYYIAGLGIVVNADNTTITKAEDLEGKAHLNYAAGIAPFLRRLPARSKTPRFESSTSSQSAIWNFATAEWTPCSTTSRPTTTTLSPQAAAR